MNLRSIVAGLFSFFVVTSVAGLRAGPPPPPSERQLTFQARITQGGQPVNGVVALTFQILDAPTAGRVLWAEDHDGSGSAPRVACTNGILSVVLGADTPIPSDVFTPGGGDRYVAIVLGGSELARVKLTAGAYAVASSVAGAVWDPVSSTALDVSALDGRYVEASGDSVVLSGDVTGTGQWLASPISADRGGTGQTSWQRGDLLYATSATETVRLPAGQEGQVLTMRGGVPRWEAPTATRARYVLRHFPGTQQGTIVIPTGFTPRLVLVTGTAGAGFFAIAHSEPGAGIEQMGYAFDVTGHGGWATHYGVLINSFGAEWRVTRMNETDVRIAQPQGGAFLGWIAVMGEE